MKGLLLASVGVLALVGPVCSAGAADVRMYVRHQVADYAAWRTVYDDFDADRKSMGVTAAAVYQSVDNPNDVTVLHDFQTADAAKTFASWEKLKNAMQKAGVKGAPQIWFVVQADK